MAIDFGIFSSSVLLSARYSTGLEIITVPQVLMLLVGLFFLYLAIAKKYEPLLLLPLAFGIIIANIPLANLSAYDVFESAGQIRPGLMNFMYGGILYVIFPPLVFLCIGTMTDFAPLISNPKLALIGIGGQLGIIVAFAIAFFVLGQGAWLTSIIPGFDGFTPGQAASIGIIGGSDGPTAIFAASRMAPEILSTVAIAAFSYMALVPFIQPPIMKWLTTDKERKVVMPAPKNVTRKQKILFPILGCMAILLLVPAAGSLVAMFMLGNLLKESGVTGRYIETLQNALLNILTIFVAISIGSSASADKFLTTTTLLVVALGLVAFAFGTIGGVLVAKLLCKITGGKINPLIGNSGVSAMPMAARISQKLGQHYNSQNYLLMHAMGALVSGVVLSTVFAGIFIAFFG
ncbi:MAG: sodium ion-translocating decarboxylase subunit beta [Bacteroidales bacterium]|nr:sodium ion-translocating decarboxylase subunit beta [Bacteroidales bacterium]